MDTKSDTNTCHKTGFLLDLENGGACKQNGNDLDHIFLQRSTNGKEASQGVYDDYDDEDFGPETDVDTVDDVLLSPAIAAAKLLANANKNQLLIENQAAVDVSPELQKDQLGEFDGAAPRGDTPTPPADEVANVIREVVEVDNAGESGEDSEDEWNYFAVEPKKKPALETIALPQEKATDCEPSEADQDSLDMESRLNPNAAEFVPSPTHIVPGFDECLLACSPRKDEKREIAAVPSEKEFDQEVRKCPSEEIEQLDNNVEVISNKVQSLNLQTPDFFTSSLQTSKNPFENDLKNEVNENVSHFVSENVCNSSITIDSESSIDSDIRNNPLEHMSFELKKEVCPEKEPEPERVCLDNLIDDIEENGLSPTASPDVSEPSLNKDKIEFDPFVAICPPKPSDLMDYQLDSLVERIHAELKESAQAVLSSCTTLPDTTGFDETGGSLSPLDTDAAETKPDSTSDMHLFEHDLKVSVESKHVDNVTLSGSSTDSSPVDLDGSLNKHLEDVGPSGSIEAYEPLDELNDASPLCTHVESLFPVHEEKPEVSPSRKYFGDDTPFHGFAESEPFQDNINDALVKQKNAENESLLRDAVGDTGNLHDRIENVATLQDRVEDENIFGLKDHVVDKIDEVVNEHSENVTIQGTFYNVSNNDLNAVHQEINESNSFGDLLSSETAANEELAEKFLQFSVEAATDSVKNVDDFGAAFDSNSQFLERNVEAPFNSTVTSIVEPHFSTEFTEVVNVAELEQEAVDVRPSAPSDFVLEESEIIKIAAEALEKEVKDFSIDVSKTMPESVPTSPPPTPAVVEMESEVAPTFKPEVLFENVEKLIASPSKENEVRLEQQQDSKVDELIDKSSMSDVAPAAVVAAAAAVAVGTAVAAEKADVKKPTPAKTPTTLKVKKPLLDKTRSPATQKSSASQKTSAASPRVPLSTSAASPRVPLSTSAASPRVPLSTSAVSPRASLGTAASRTPAKTTLSPTKTPTSVRKTATPLKPKLAAASPTTATSASSTPKSKPLTQRPSTGGVKSPAPLKSSPAPIPRARPTSAVAKTAVAEKKAPITNGMVSKPPAKEPVTVKRTVSSAKTAVQSTATTKQPASRLTTRTTTTTTSTAARPKSLTSSTTAVRQARAPISAVMQKQVKDTANKEISSARPASAVSIGRTSTTSTTTRRTVGVTRTTTTTTTSKSNLGNKLTTKKTTTITSRISDPAKAKSPAIENNEQITTTMISTEMKVDPIETTQHVLLE